MEFERVSGSFALRRKVYEELEPAARSAKGLSRTNIALVIFILAAALAAVVETEPTVSSGREAIFRLLELTFGLIFLVEYVARIWVSPEHPKFARSRFPRLRYMVTPAALIDLVSVLPALLAFGGGGTLVLRFFRLLRIARLAKLGRMSRAWLHVREALMSRSYELGLTLGFGAIVMLTSGTLMYWAEGTIQPDKFGSIPRALWWSAVTLTTVGYGDVFPITALGRTISAIVAVLGIGLIALPAGILASAFSDAVQRDRGDSARDDIER